MTRFCLCCLAAIVFLVPRVRAENPGGACASCHANEASEWSRSVHASVSCQECHGGAKEYLDSGRTASAKFDHGDGFRGRIGRGQVPETCGVCHADVSKMNPFGLRTDQLAAYWTSGHGRALRDRGDERVAVCVDCHGVHDIRPAHDIQSRTHPFNVPDTCGRCHADATLMASVKLPVEVVAEYRESVHGQLLIEQHDSGAPTCATCHGNHAATPPGFATVGSVCGKCHEHASRNFATSVHAKQEEHKGCVQCHGGGAGRHFHRIERITKPAGVLIDRYAHLMKSSPQATAQEVTEAVHPDPRRIVTGALPTCLECHEDPADDKSLKKLFDLLDQIADAERLYVATAQRLNEVGRGVLLVDHARFTFEDAKTHLIELAPLQHTLNNEAVAAKVDELREVCTQVTAELDGLEDGLRWRYRALIPIWGFTILFAAGWYAKYKRLRHLYVKPFRGDVG